MLLVAFNSSCICECGAPRIIENRSRVALLQQALKIAAFNYSPPSLHGKCKFMHQAVSRLNPPCSGVSRMLVAGSLLFQGWQPLATLNKGTVCYLASFHLRSTDSFNQTQ